MVTGLLLAALPLIPMILTDPARSILPPPLPSAGWDEAHGIGWDLLSEPAKLIAVLLERSMGLPAAQTYGLALGSLAALGLLLALDCLSVFFPVIAWPRSWNTQNSQCYNEMFCEPTRPRYLPAYRALPFKPS